MIEGQETYSEDVEPASTEVEETSVLEPIGDDSEDLAGVSRADYVQRRAERKALRTADRRRRWWVWLLAGIAAFLVLLSGYEALASYGRVHPGVTVAGVDIGGQKPARAIATLEAQLPKRAAQPVQVVYGDKSWTYQSTELGLGFDYDASVAAAMKVGRESGSLEPLVSRWAAWARGVDVSATPTADEVLLDKALKDIAAGTDVKPVDATVKIEGVEPVVVPGKDGISLDREAASTALLAAFLGEDRTVEVPVVSDSVEVDDSEAKAAAETARKMLSAPVTITFEKKSWEFAPQKVAKWIAFRRSDETSVPAGQESDGVGLVAIIDSEATSKTVIPTLGADVGRPAKDAQFKTANGKVTIIPSQDGIGPDIKSLAAALTSELSGGEGDRKVALVTTRTEPAITTDKARSMGINERISTYTTTFSAGNKPRVNNIHLLGDSLDGRLVGPGETFSFNGTVGERTAEKGYKEANAIVNGKLVPQLGGGICQVNTTLFNAVFESGLPVVERKNHSQYISHYPKGRDATVSWGGPDFKFKNDTDKWVLISVSYTSSSVTISLYGTDPGYDVSAETGPWTNVTSYPVEEVKDPTLAAGARVVEEAGITGRTITVKRIVKKDGKVVRTDEFVSKYRAAAQVVRVGTKTAGSKSTTTAP